MRSSTARFRSATPPLFAASRAVDVALLGVAVVWGSSYLVAKNLTAVAPVLVVLVLRYALSAAALTVECLRRRVRARDREELGVGIALGCTQTTVLVLETFGVAHTTATNAGLIISLTVVFTPLLDSVWSRTALPASFFLATAVAVVGVGLLVSGDGFRTPGWGDALMLTAAAVRAGHVSLIGRLTRGRVYHSLVLTTVQALTGAAVLTVVALPRAQVVTALPLSAWAQLAYLSLACTVFAFLVQTWAIRRTSPSRASLLMGTEPVWALAVGVTLAGDHLTAVAAFGAVLVLVATFTGQRIERTHRLGRASPAPTPAGRPGGAPDPAPCPDRVDAV